MMPSTEQLQAQSDPSQARWIKRYYGLEPGRICTLTNDERGLFLSLRELALCENGFATDPNELWQEAKAFLALSRYKFLKLYPRVIKKFAIFDGKFFFEPDLQCINESREKTLKYREYGKLGAQAKWSNASKVTEMPAPEEMAKPSDPAIGSGGGISHHNPSVVDVVPPLSVEEGESRGEGVSPAVPQPTFPKTQALIASRFPTVSAKFMNQLGDACRQVDPAVTDEVLCAGISAVCTDEQTSAGLFLRTLPAYLANRNLPQTGEILRPRRKPNRKEEQQIENYEALLEFATRTHPRR